MANDSISSTQHAECIRMQAERVVRAHNELRGTAKNSDFKGDDFPVGKFAELFQQLRQLDHWLQPVEGEDEETTSAAQTFSEYAERELSNVKKLLVEIDHLAHDGQNSSDPTVTLAVIERLAAEGQSVLYGEFWDKLTDGLKRANGRPPTCSDSFG